MSTVPKCIYLSGAAWGCAFYIGCFKAFNKRYGRRKMKKVILHGDSSGSLIALGLILGNLRKIDKLYTEMAAKAEKNGVKFKMTKYLGIALDKLLKDKNAYKKVNGRLRVGISLYPDKYKVCDTFHSNEHLRHIIRCSSHVPLYTSYLGKVDGQTAIDGIFASDVSKFPRTTLVIGMGITKNEFDIIANLNLKQCATPLTGRAYDKVKRDGYNKGMAWNGYERRNLVFPLSVWWFLSFLERPFLKTNNKLI
jgi:hypothetical protein